MSALSSAIEFGKLIANGVDADQSAPHADFGSGSILYACKLKLICCLSEKKYSRQDQETSFSVASLAGI